jgi:hypothetical protein
MNAKPRRRWNQFSLRTMFVGVTVACVGVGLSVGWVQHSQEWIRQRHQALDLNQIREREDRWFPIATGPETTAPRMLWLFGEKGTSEISLFYGDDQQVVEIKSLFPEAVVTHFPRRPPESAEPPSVIIPTLPAGGEGQRYITPPP